MKTYIEARQERLERNQAQLFELAKSVLKSDPKIEIYHYDGDRPVQGLVFIKGENINSIHFHEVPYRWSGCGYGEHNNSTYGGENYSMPFTTEDVITTFQPITTVKKTYKDCFKSIESYLEWCSYLTKYNSHELV